MEAQVLAHWLSENYVIEAKCSKIREKKLTSKPLLLKQADDEQALFSNAMLLAVVVPSPVSQCPGPEAPAFVPVAL